MSPNRSRPFSLTNDMANRLLLPLLKSSAGGLMGRQLAVVQYTGRRSGLAHELVTQYVMDGPTVRISVGRSENKTWWRNFQTPYPMGLHLAGDAHTAMAHVERNGNLVFVLAELTTLSSHDPDSRRKDVVMLHSSVAATPIPPSLRCRPQPH